jgi:glycosyltransferase involved in cell wall biosynthesis
LAWHIVRALDEWGFRPERTAKYASISNTVAERSEYFPPDVNVQPIYIPPSLPAATGSYDYFFTTSRLAYAKRMDLIIEAMRLVKAGIRLKIAGTGPMGDFLEQMAGADERIEFLGFVSEEELTGLYANALGVIFVPRDEDLGLITLEAMQCAKPVLTVSDSGGPTEFVEDGVTGFVAEPNPESLAEKMQILADDPALAERMGREAKNRVEDITWEKAVGQLMEGVETGRKSRYRSKGRRRKILSVSTYRGYPPRNGGEHRLFHLNRNFARHHDVTLLALVRSFMEYEDQYVAPNLRQVCIPKAPDHARRQWDAENEIGCDLYDVMMIDNLWYTPQFVERFKDLSREADAIIFEQPYLFSAAAEIEGGGVIVHSSQNIEFELKKHLLEGSEKGRELLERVFAVEKLACEQSDVTFATHNAEEEDLSRLYGVPLKQILVLPNGVDVEEITPVKAAQRRRQKEKLGLDNLPTFLFIGSWHPPNLEALEFIVDRLAPERPGWVFLVPGTVKNFFEKQYPDRRAPDNVLLFGEITEAQKKAIYQAADCALNPMFSGSGTNLKTVDFLSSGLPTVATRIGLRGLDVGQVVYESEPEDFIGHMEHILSHPEEAMEKARLGRRLVEDLYHWGSIADRGLERIEQLWSGHSKRLWKKKGRTVVEYGPGWFGMEWDQGLPFHWTRSRALAVVPHPGADGCVFMEMKGTRRFPHVRVMMGTQEVFSGNVAETDWQDFRFPVPEGIIDDYITLRWEAETFCYGQGDGRHLGVAVRNIRLENPED